MWVAFALQKLLTFFQQKISDYCALNPLKQFNEITLNELVNDDLNNWALVCLLINPYFLRKIKKNKIE